MADLGLAGFIGPGSGGASVSLVGGTAGYMPPEARSGTRDRSWDLYSVAATYVKLRTGKEPFGTGDETLKRQQDGEFVVDGLEAAEVDALRQALTPEPQSRLQCSVSDFFEMIRPPRRPRSEVDPFQELPAVEGPLKYLPAAEFVMGSPPDEPNRSAEEQQHRVRISRPFEVGVHPVTVREFKHFVEANGYRSDAERKTAGGYVWNAHASQPYPEWKANVRWQNPGFSQSLDHPVVLVSWNDCREYCVWLSRCTGKEFRMLTEAEWEYLCRGGSVSYTAFAMDDGTALSSQHANFQSALGRTSPVGAYPPSGLGLYDLHGNVWEWCQDYYEKDYYRGGPPVDPAGPAAGPDHVIRGGCWNSPVSDCRSACRKFAKASDRYNYVGFRVKRILD